MRMPVERGSSCAIHAKQHTRVACTAARVARHSPKKHTQHKARTHLGVGLQQGRPGVAGLARVNHGRSDAQRLQVSVHQVVRATIRSALHQRAHTQAARWTAADARWRVLAQAASRHPPTRTYTYIYTHTHTCMSMWSPACSSASRVLLMAAMPDASGSAASVPAVRGCQDGW
jgi:hypothetical protein